MNHTAPTPLLRADRIPAATPWLTLAERAQLERDLADLPELADHLDRDYAALLGRGSRSHNDPRVRVPIDPAILDLADSRLKGDAWADPMGEADLARRIGSRRQGILPTLRSWVLLAEGEMLDDGARHTDPAEAPTVTTEAGWLAVHLDWIGGQQWVVELATDARGIVADAEALVGPVANTPDKRACVTALDAVDLTGVPLSTLYRWRACGWLSDVGCNPEGRWLLVLHEVRSLMRRSA